MYTARGVIKVRTIWSIINVAYSALGVCEKNNPPIARMPCWIENPKKSVLNKIPIRFPDRKSPILRKALKNLMLQNANPMLEKVNAIPVVVKVMPLSIFLWVAGGQ